MGLRPSAGLHQLEACGEGAVTPQRPAPFTRRSGAHCQLVKLEDGPDRLHRKTRNPRRGIKLVGAPTASSRRSSYTENRVTSRRQRVICNPTNGERTVWLPVGGPGFRTGSGVVERCAGRPALPQVPNGGLGRGRLTPAPVRCRDGGAFRHWWIPRTSGSRLPEAPVARRELGDERSVAMYCLDSR